jgi:hypothetical protein
VDGITRRRKPHSQSITLDDRKTPKRIEQLQFIGHVRPETIKFDRFNALTLQITIPAEFVEDALDLRYMAGCPLSIDVQKWKPAQTANPYRIVPGSGGIRHINDDSPSRTNGDG